MNRNTWVGFKQNEVVLEEETNQKKKFVKDNFCIDYCNTSKIFSQNKPAISDIRVKNFLCYQEGQTLCKVTEILYEDKLIRIEDRFEVSPDPTPMVSCIPYYQEKLDEKEKKTSRNIEKVRLFCNNPRKISSAERKDKKNIVKNIIKIFLSWLEKNHENSTERDALDELTKLLKFQKYNNRLVKKIASNSQISKQFLRFLMEVAGQEIRYSRIKDKQSHYEALQIYKELLSNNQNGEQPLSAGTILYSSHESNDLSSQQKSVNNIVNKANQVSQNTFMESGSSYHAKNHEARMQPKIETAESWRKNKIILVQNGVEYSK